MKRLFTTISLTLLLSCSCQAMQMQEEAQEQEGNLVGAVIEGTFSLIGSILSAPFKLGGIILEGLMADPGDPDDPKHDPEKEARDRNAIFGRLEMERRHLRAARDAARRECILNKAHMDAFSMASSSAESRFPNKNSALRKSAFNVARNDINASRKQLDTTYRLPATRKNLD